MEMISAFGSGILNTTVPQKLLINILSEFKYFFFKSKLKTALAFLNHLYFIFKESGRN